jgi:hypothetical protein
MKLNVKLLAPATLLLAVGCGGTHSASVTFPFVRVFNGVDTQTSIQVQIHDLNANLLSTSPSVALGVANPPPDMNFVYSEGNATVIDENGAPLFAGASVQYAQNMKYTIVACGASTSYETVVLTDNEGAVPAGSFAIRFIDAAILANAGNPVDCYLLPAGTAAPLVSQLPTVAGLHYATIPTAANATGIDSNGYITLPDGGATTFSVVFTAAGSQTPLFPAQAITIADGSYNTDVMWDTGTTPALAADFLADKR